METSPSSQDSDNSVPTPDTEASAPKRRTTRPTRGKSATPRTRKKAEPGDEPASAPADSSEAPAATEESRPARAPRGRRSAKTPPVAQEVFSFSPDDEAPVERPEPAPRAEPAFDSAPVADAPAPAPVARPEPAGDSEGSARAESPTPRSDEGGAPTPDSGDEQGAAGGPPKRFGRDYWKQLKLEKKKAKLLRKHSQGGGGGGGGGYAPAPTGGGSPHQGGGPLHGRGKHRERDRDRERGPAQPPPPEFVTVTGELPPIDRFADLAALEAIAADLASGGGEPIAIDTLAPMPIGELVAFARAQGVVFDGVPNRHQATKALLEHAAAQKRPIIDRGWLDLTDRGHGFIVHSHDNYRLYPDDTLVPESLVRRYGLKRGVQLEVQVQPGQQGERCPASIKVISAMGRDPELLAKVEPFEELVPYYPLQRILLEVPGAPAKDISMRLVDIVTPIGFGQRGLIVAPPRTGKTVLMQNIANSVSANFPEVKLIILLVDERPEEVTDFKRHTKGEVVSSTFDESPANHVHCAEMVIERSRRLVEAGEHVVILLDSITRLARAYNALTGNSGKIMSGGLEATALQKPKRFFGSARNIEGGGSLTIVGTALVDTGSKMDEVIFEEFKGTGNMELHLDRDLVNKRIFPAVNMDKSGTRKEELLYHPDELQRIFSMRRAMQGLPGTESMEMLISRLKKTKSNVEFLMGLNR